MTTTDMSFPVIHATAQVLAVHGVSRQAFEEELFEVVSQAERDTLFRVLHPGERRLAGRPGTQHRDDESEECEAGDD